MWRRSQNRRPRLIRRDRYWNFLSRTATPQRDTYRQLLRDEAEFMRSHSDTYLYHEHLEENNHPLYFHEFVNRAEDAEFAVFGRQRFLNNVGC